MPDKLIEGNKIDMVEFSQFLGIIINSSHMVKSYLFNQKK